MFFWSVQVRPDRFADLLKKDISSVGCGGEKWWSVLPDLAICSKFGYFSCKIATKIWLLFLQTFWQHWW